MGNVVRRFSVILIGLIGAAITALLVGESVRLTGLKMIGGWAFYHVFFLPLTASLWVAFASWRDSKNASALTEYENAGRFLRQGSWRVALCCLLAATGFLFPPFGIGSLWIGWRLFAISAKKSLEGGALSIVMLILGAAQVIYPLLLFTISLLS